MTKRNVISYVRVSTDEQAKMGHSLDHQKMMIDKYCEVKGYNILKEFQEDFSAKSFTNRPKWQELLRYIKANKKIVDEVLILRWDRFSRNLQEALSTIAELRKMGVSVNSIEQPLDMSIPDSKILLSLYLTIPEVENDKNSIRVTESSRKAKLEGCWMGTPPYGYKNHKIGKYATLIPFETKKFVVEAFNEVATNVYSVDEVRKRLNKKGMTLTKQSFLNMLRNVVYVGKILVKEYKKEAEVIVKGLHEPMVSDGLFQDVQDVLEGKKKYMPLRVQ
jgi:site-specific DNA recombinase